MSMVFIFLINSQFTNSREKVLDRLSKEENIKFKIRKELNKLFSIALLILLVALEVTIKILGVSTNKRFAEI